MRHGLSGWPVWGKRSSNGLVRAAGNPAIRGDKRDDRHWPISADRTGVWDVGHLASASAAQGGLFVGKAALSPLDKRQKRIVHTRDRTSLLPSKQPALDRLRDDGAIDGGERSRRHGLNQHLPPTHMHLVTAGERGRPLTRSLATTPRLLIRAPSARKAVRTSPIRPTAYISRFGSHATDAISRIRRSAEEESRSSASL